MTAQTILPANSVTGGFEVANSLRFDNNAYMQSGNTNSTNNPWTFSVWIKRAKVGAEQTLIMSYTDSNDFGLIRFGSDDTLLIGDYVNGSYVMKYETNRKFRDVSAWYHIVVSQSAVSGASPATLLYVNGVQETSFGTSNAYSQNDTQNWQKDGENFNFMMGQGEHYQQAYVCEAVWIDNTVYAASDFGEFDEDSGIWKPKDPSGLNFGTNGFYFDFADSGNLGDNEAGNSRADFSENNIAATDQATDTCTNNFCTMNPLIPTTNATFSQGNCKLTIGGSSIQGAGIGTFGLTAGKWYFEVKLLADKDNHTHGAISELTAELNANVTAIQNDVGVTSWINGDGGEVVVDGTATTADYGIMAENSIMGIALDIDNYNITYLDDNSALVSNFNMSSTRGTIFPLIKMGINCAAEVNFGGCSAFAVSSANSDADGHGNFEHAPPSGYFAICSKNLAEYG